jgi:hypothetical protein
MCSYSKNNPKSVYFTEDIIEELSIKTGKDKKLLRDIISKNMDYIKKSIDENQEIVVINFPNFGKLMFNYNLGCSSIPRVSNNRLKEKLINRVNYLYYILTVKKDSNLKNFNKSILSTLLYNLTGSTPKNAINNFYKNWKILEDKHNEDHESKFKKSIENK